MQMKTKHISQSSIMNRFGNPEYCCRIILILGLILKILYVAQVKYDYSPHDLGTIISDGSALNYGHLPYIQYLYLHRSIPDTYSGAFYHPPLFHIIGAIVLAVHHVTDNYDVALESLQMLNMLFASVGVLYGYRIIKKIGKNDWSLVVGTAFLSFCPAFYIIGAEVNNDCLVTMFMIMALYYTLCWREKQNIFNILKIALCIGLGMLTKTSGALISFAVGGVFLYTLIENWKEWRRFFKQFVLFGMVCVPLGLVWNIYRCMKYHIPFNYILKLSLDSNQYVGDFSLWSRIGIPSASQLTSCSIDWKRPAKFCNIWGQTFLTMNYDEGILKIDDQMGKVLAVVLLWVSIFLSILFFCILLRVIFSQKTELSYKILFPINFLIIYGHFIKFSFDYPHICTMNFRYIVVVQILLSGVYVLYHKNHSAVHFVNRCIGFCVAVQSILSTYLYLIYAV